jgi:hypothetical protein
MWVISKTENNENDFLFRQNESSSASQPLSLQIANSMEKIIENNILHLAGNIRGEDFKLHFQC